MTVDVFSHHISKSVCNLLEGGFHYPSKNSDPEVRMNLMDKYGVDVQAICLSAPTLYGLDDKDAANMCRLANTDNYALCKAYPKRFVNVCILSLLDMHSAMNELDRSINELDCRGVTVATNQNGKGLDSPEYFPLYEKLVEHDIPLFLHPTTWESYPLVDMENSWRMMLVFGWPFDTTQAVWRLIFGGVIDHYPSLKIVTHHLGAMLPYFARRIEQTFNRALADKLPRHISEYWGNIYGDTAIDGTMAAFMCGHAFFGSDRMMYGSDYPFGAEEGEDFIRENLAGIKAMNIPIEDKQKILGGNAKKLLKING